MFTLEQIHTAHAMVKSGADFPAYVQALIQLGVARYTNFVDDGHIVYYGEDNFSITSEAQYAPLAIAIKGDKRKFAHTLTIHQQGKTDYQTFCHQAAEAGVAKWVVDMKKMTCEYFDKQDQLLIQEMIPVRK